MISRVLPVALDRLIPSDPARGIATHRQMQMLILGLMFGPLFADGVLLYLYFALPAFRFPLWILGAAVQAFWLLPLGLKTALRLNGVVFLAVSNLIFVTLYATLCYGGAGSPFLPWVVAAGLVALLCLGKRPLRLVGAVMVNLAGFFAAYAVSKPFLQPVSASHLADIGVMTLLATTACVGWMAFCWSKAAIACANLAREATRQHSRIARMRQATEAAEAANSRKSDFLVNTTYRLRTPLNAVIGYSEMMLEDAGLYDEQQLADVSRINLASKHLLSLVADVLDISKIESSETELAVQSFDVTRFLSNIVTTAGNLVAANGNELTVHVATEVGVMISDEVRLRQIVFNLLSNAGKFTKNGRVTLQADRENDGRIDWIKISVTDNGIGISSSNLQKLFGNFNQAEASTASTYGGTGLGLAICRDFCRTMGGTIAVESEHGKGSRFTVRLPADVGDDRVQRLIGKGRKCAEAA